ncbi:unnamed protein product [Orchesella dallaii]|uniref:Uncharacterized protein n=1 Tax=Orchesella dallaii TaxID=48710 RepID=A0ABP1RYW3_9HEXA
MKPPVSSRKRSVISFATGKMASYHYHHLILLIISSSLVLAHPKPQDNVEINQPELTTPTESPPGPETTTFKSFLSYLFQREGNRDPWLAQLVKATAPVLAEEGFGGVIRQSFKIAPVLALGAVNQLANTRIGPLLNFPEPPTTTLLPKRRGSEKDDY